MIKGVLFSGQTNVRLQKKQNDFKMSQPLKADTVQFSTKNQVSFKAKPVLDPKLFNKLAELLNGTHFNSFSVFENEGVLN